MARLETIAMNRSTLEILPALPSALVALVALLALALAPPALAQHKAHVHGVVKLDMAVQGNTLAVQLEAPLDSLLGFEHRPRTDAQRQAAAAVLRQLNDGAALFKPDAAAGCTVTRTEVNGDALIPATSTAAGGASPKDTGHADLDASYEFTCTAPALLAGLEQALFSSFKRISRIEVQVAGARGQTKQTLRRPAGRVTLVR